MMMIINILILMVIEFQYFITDIIYFILYHLKISLHTSFRRYLYATQSMPLYLCITMFLRVTMQRKLLSTVFIYLKDRNKITFT